FERAGMAVAAELDPQVREPQRLAEAIRPKQVRAAFVHRDDAVVVELRHHPLFLAPDAAGVRPAVAALALVEEARPARGIALFERVQVMANFQELAALGAVVDDLLDVVAALTASDAAKCTTVFHGARV